MSCKCLCPDWMRSTTTHNFDGLPARRAFLWLLNVRHDTGRMKYVATVKNARSCVRRRTTNDANLVLNVVRCPSWPTGSRCDVLLFFFHLIFLIIVIADCTNDTSSGRKSKFPERTGRVLLVVSIAHGRDDLSCRWRPEKDQKVSKVVDVHGD